MRNYIRIIKITGTLILSMLTTASARGDLPNPLTIQEAISRSQAYYSISSSEFKVRAGRAKMIASILGLFPSGTLTKNMTRTKDAFQIPPSTGNNNNNNNDGSGGNGSGNSNGLPAPYNNSFVDGFSVTLFDGGVSLFNIFAQHATLKNLEASREVTANAVAQQVVQSYVLLAAADEQVLFYKDEMQELSVLKQTASTELLNKLFEDSIQDATLKELQAQQAQSQSGILLLQWTDPQNRDQPIPTLAQTLTELTALLDVPDSLQTALAMMKKTDPAILAAKATASGDRYTKWSQVAAAVGGKLTYSDSTSDANTLRNNIPTESGSNSQAIVGSVNFNLSGIANAVGAGDTQASAKQDLLNAMATQETTVRTAYIAVQPQGGLNDVWAGQLQRFNDSVQSYQTTKVQIEADLAAIAAGQKPPYALDGDAALKLIERMESALNLRITSQSDLVLAKAQILAALGSLDQIQK